MDLLLTNIPQFPTEISVVTDWYAIGLSSVATLVGALAGAWVGAWQGAKAARRASLDVAHKMAIRSKIEEIHQIVDDLIADRMDGINHFVSEVSFQKDNDYEEICLIIESHSSIINDWYHHRLKSLCGIYFPMALDDIEDIHYHLERICISAGNFHASPAAESKKDFLNEVVSNVRQCEIYLHKLSKKLENYLTG